MLINIKKIYLFTLLFLSLFCLSSIIMGDEQLMAQQNDYAKIVYDKLKKKYNSLKSYQADLITEVTVSKDIEVRLSGQISIEFPDKWLIKLKSAREKEQKLCYFSLSDGENIWQLDSTLNVMLKTRFNKGSKMTGHFFPIFSAYDNKKLKIEKLGEYEVISMEMEPGKKEDIFSRIEIFLDPEKNEIVKLRFIGLDSLSKMSISFSNIKIDGNLPEDIFKFNPIPEVKVKECK